MVVVLIVMGSRVMMGTGVVEMMMVPVVAAADRAKDRIGRAQVQLAEGRFVFGRRSMAGSVGCHPVMVVQVKVPPSSSSNGGRGLRRGRIQRVIRGRGLSTTTPRAGTTTSVVHKDTGQAHRLWPLSQ